MKKSHIIGLIIIAVAVGIIVTTAGDASSYVTFSQASNMAESGNNNKIHVVGELKKSESGEIIGIEDSDDHLSFRFIMVDQDGKEETVYYAEPMPADFKRSEQVVVIGSFKNDVFIADKILMKCPSKYQEEQVTAQY